MTKYKPDAAELRLVEQAEQLLDRAHCPYSGYRVGAALLAADGTVFGGCNVENASYGLTVCAERTAFLTAVAAGQRSFTALAVVSSGDEAPVPCGACRQVMAEFCGPDLRVTVARAGNPLSAETYVLGELLPNAFRFE